MTHLVLFIALTWAAGCRAEHAELAVPALFPAALAQQWLMQDPSVLAAQSELAAAQVEAQQTAASPYEWTSRLSYQQRDYSTGSVSHEWNVGLERQIRLPAKRRADQALAGATIAAAQAQLELARRQAADDLVGGWLGWLTAHAITASLTQQQRFAEDNVGAVAKRIKSGDAAQIDYRLAIGEVSAIERSVSAARTEEAIAYAKLSARFAIEGMQPLPLPEPLSPPHDVGWWQARTLAVSAQLAAAKAAQAKAEAGVARAAAERMPDPTLGVYAASEAHGDENIVGGTLSIPFPGTRRTLEVQRRVAQVNAARDRRAALELELNGSARAAYANAMGTYASWQLSRNGADVQRENAVIAQKAYTLGEQDLQTLLLARRQALSAAEADQQARAAALRAYVALLLEAKLLWQPALPEVAEP